jgi:hypothetical protein
MASMIRRRRSRTHADDKRLVQLIINERMVLNEKKNPIKTSVSEDLSFGIFFMSGFYAQKLSGLLKNTVKVEFFF